MTIDPTTLSHIIDGVIAFGASILGSGATLTSQWFSNKHQDKSKTSEKAIEGYQELLRPIFGRYTSIILFADSNFVESFLDIHFKRSEGVNNVIKFLARSACSRGVFMLARSLRSKITNQPLTDAQILKLCFMSIAEANGTDRLFMNYTQPIFYALDNLFGSLKTPSENADSFRESYLIPFSKNYPMISEGELRNVIQHISPMAAARFSGDFFVSIFGFSRGDNKHVEQFESHKQLLSQVLDSYNSKFIYSALNQFASNYFSFIYEALGVALINVIK